MAILHKPNSNLSLIGMNQSNLTEEEETPEFPLKLFSQPKPQQILQSSVWNLARQKGSRTIPAEGLHVCIHYTLKRHGPEQFTKEFSCPLASAKKGRQLQVSLPFLSNLSEAGRRRTYVLPQPVGPLCQSLSLQLLSPCSHLNQKTASVGLSKLDCPFPFTSLHVGITRLAQGRSPKCNWGSQKHSMAPQDLHQIN